MKNIPIAPQIQDEIALIIALGFLRLKTREITANKALMKRKSLDFRANKSVPVMQEHDNE